MGRFLVAEVEPVREVLGERLTVTEDREERDLLRRSVRLRRSTIRASSSPERGDLDRARRLPTAI